MLLVMLLQVAPLSVLFSNEPEELVPRYIVETFAGSIASDTKVVAVNPLVVLVQLMPPSSRHCKHKCGGKIEEVARVDKHSWSPSRSMRWCSAKL